MEGFERLLSEAWAAADDDDPGRGLDRLLRYGLRCQLEDAALAAVLRSSESVCARTSELWADLSEAVGRLLRRTREAGALRPEIGADDIRRLLCGVEHAVRMGDGAPDEIDRYLGVLLDGLRAHD